MRFSVRKRRTAPAVIIVALIDVLVVLLIFLMVTTTFKQQPLVKLALPESATAQKSGAGDSLQVIIEASGVYRFGDKNLPMTFDQLRLQVLAAAAKTPDAKLAIRADKAAPWSSIVAVMDLAKEAKIKNLSAFTKDAPKTGN